MSHMFETFEIVAPKVDVHVRAIRARRGRFAALGLRAASLACAASVMIVSSGCGGVQGVVGADGVETRVTERAADGKPRRVERWQDGKMLEDRHLYSNGRTQHSVRMTKDRLVQDVVVFYEDGKTPHLRYQLHSGQMEGLVEEWD